MLKIGTGLAVLAAALALISGQARAHGDEDHSHDQEKTVAPAASASAAAGSLAAPQRLSDGSLFIPKPLQRQLGLRTQLIEIGALAATLELNGKVIPDPDSGGRVQASFAGIVMPGAKGMPVPGRKVVKGEILGYLRPVGSAIERGNQQAQQAELDAQWMIATRRLARYRQLEGALPQKEIEAAQIEADALQQRRDFVRASISSNQPLLASATGAISASYVVAGQVVDAKELLFEIVDPARLAVEALAYDMRIPASITGASALAEHTPLELKFIGAGQQLREQALPLYFRISTPKAQVAVGQPLKVMLQSGSGVQGAAVARSALVKTASGETVVWVHTGAERFVARRVRQQALDANRIAIVDGLHAGERVVIAGASLLSEVR